MIEPLENVFNWFLGVFYSLPIAVKNFIWFVALAFGIRVVLGLLDRLR